MQDEIIENLNRPEILEELFRRNESGFKKAFAAIHETHQDLEPVKFWHARLNYTAAKNPDPSENKGRDFMAMLLLCILSGTVVKILTEYFISTLHKNFWIAVFPTLSAYFLWKRKSGTWSYFVTGAIFAASCLYINMIPNRGDPLSDTLILACVFLPFFCWSLVGLSYMSFDFTSNEKRLRYLKFNGDLVVFSTLLSIAGGILIGITFALFELIKVDISQFYLKWVLVYGAAAVPIVASNITESKKSVTNQISTIVARIFSPLALITLAAYLIMVLGAGKSPFVERDCLIVFNFVLVGVMALIVFSITGVEGEVNGLNGTLLFLLCLVTILLNIIALSAIAFRITEFGTTPNRFAVLGSNLLMFGNLILILIRLFKCIRQKTSLEEVETAVTRYLPLYAGWSFIVVFLFPVLFHFN